MQLKISYSEYLSRIAGGWIGKSLGGALGARYEGFKVWQELSIDEAFPDELPPNDDLDLQVLWLKVLEEKGAAVTARDLAEAWLAWCWYPFNEYGNFRRSWRQGIAPPCSGTFRNRFFDTGEGCPIRAEIWGYVFPGAPELAAKYAGMDGSLDHGEESIGAEMMWAAMAADAFFESDLRGLIERHRRRLPEGSRVAKIVEGALRAYDEGLSLREARDRLILRWGHPEACDARLNTGFAVLGLLYGHGDMEQTLLSCLRCGYDTDCTLATAGALVGQVLGRDGIDEALRARVGDSLVMGIRYKRPEMTLSALARDTARIGCLFSEAFGTGVEVTDAPRLDPLPPAEAGHGPQVIYEGAPECIMGQTVRVKVEDGATIAAEGEGWRVEDLGGGTFALSAPSRCRIWADTHRFTARTPGGETSFGLAGAAPWIFLGAYFEPIPPLQGSRIPRTIHEVIELTGASPQAMMNEHFLDMQKDYIGAPHPDVPALWKRWRKVLGSDPVVWARQDRIDPSDLVGLEGPYCAYLLRELVCPDDRKVWLVIGNNDAFRVWINGELVADVDEKRWWTPYAHVLQTALREGVNEVLLQLFKRGEAIDFQLGFRHVGERGSFNCEDWCVDLGSLDPYRYASGS